VRNAFSLPANIIPFSIVPVGYPIVEVPVPERYDKSRVHYERW
jgi:hypothetical protein